MGKKKNLHVNWHTYFERPAEFGRCLLFTPCSKPLPFELEATLHPAVSLLWEFSRLARAAISKRSYKSGRRPSKYRNCSYTQNVSTWLLFYKVTQITKEIGFHNKCTYEAEEEVMRLSMYISALSMGKIFYNKTGNINILAFFLFENIHPSTIMILIRETIFPHSWFYSINKPHIFKNLF